MDNRNENGVQPNTPNVAQNNVQQLTKKQRRAIRSYRGRFFKNLFIWLIGVISCIPLLLCTIFGVLYFVPLKTLTGDISGDKVSSNVAEKGIFDVLMHIEDYSMADLPVVSQMLQQAIEDNNLDQYVEVDIDKVNALQFKYSDGRNFTDELTKCITVTASLNSVGATDMLGDLKNLEVFSEWKVATTVDETAEGFNGNLYYYKTGSGDNAKYLKAYDKNGTKVAPTGETLYYANLADISVLDVLDILDERLGIISLANLLETVGVGEITSDSIIGKIVGDKTLADANSLGMDLLVSDLLGDNNDSLYEILCSAVNVPAGEERPTKETLSIQHIIDYGLAIDNVSLNAVLPNDDGSNDAIYDILNAAITDENEDGQIQIGELSSLNVNNIDLGVVLPEAENENIYDILRAATGVAEGEVITIGNLSSFNVENIDLDVVLPEAENQEIYDILRAAAGIDDGENITIADLSNVDVNNISLSVVLPEAENQEIYDILRAAAGIDDGEDITIGDLSSFDVKNVDLESVLPRAENEDAYKILDQGYEDKNSDGKIQIGELSITIDDIDLESVLPRANNENIYEVLDAAINGGADGIQIGELKNFSIDNVSLETVLPRENEDGEPINTEIYKILDVAINAGTDGVIQISEISSFNIETINLTSVIDKTKNAKLYDILSGLYDNVDNITVGDLNSFDINKLNLSIVLEEAGNEEIYKILNAAINSGADGIIQIGELSDFTTNNIILSSVIPNNTDNAELYKVLSDIYGASRVNTITLGEIKDFNLNDISLETFLPKASNANLYNILGHAINAGTDGKIQIGEFSTFNTGNIVLSTVIPHDASNAHLYEVLEDLYGNSVDNITLNDLHDFNTNNLHLGVALPKASHEELYSILESAITLPAGIDSVEKIALGELDSHFSADDIVLKDFIGENEALEKIFNDAYKDAGKTYATVTMGDLKNFSLDEVKLSSVLDETGNNIIDTLIAKEVKLKDIGTEINALTLYEVYGTECFTTTAVAGSPRYTKSIVGGKEVYTYSATGEYYISESAGIWLLLCFDAENVGTDGRPATYTASTATVSDLQNNSSALSVKFSSATIRQLVDAGIIESANELLMSKSLNDVLNPS